MLVVVFTITNFDTSAFAEISLSSYDSTISPTDRLLIMGTIKGDIQSFNAIKLVVYDPSGNVVYRPNVAIDGDGKFKYMITPTLPRFDDGTYTVEASQENLQEKTQIQFTVSSDMSKGMFDEIIDAIPEPIIPEVDPFSPELMTAPEPQEPEIVPESIIPDMDAFSPELMTAPEPQEPEIVPESIIPDMDAFSPELMTAPEPEPEPENISLWLQFVKLFEIFIR